MSRILGIVLFLAVLAGCASKKKSALTAEAVSIVTEKTELQHADVIRMIDTTRTESGRVTVTEIEYFPPAVGANLAVAQATPAIKSIRQTIIETQTQTRG